MNQKLQNPQILRVNYVLSHEHLQILVSAGIWGNQIPMNTEYRHVQAQTTVLEMFMCAMIPSFSGFNFLYLRHGLTRLLKFIKVLSYMNLSINKNE